MMRLALIESLLRQLPIEVHTFLEIGPGMGDVAVYMDNLYRDARGTLMDFSGESINLLRSRVHGNKSLEVVAGDFTTYQHEGRYDLIVACEVFEHIEDDLSALQAVAGLLNGGGYFLFSAPAFMNKWQASDEYAGHYRRYERDEIKKKFSSVGLSIETLWCFGFPVTEMLYPLRQWYYGRRDLQLPTKREATERSGVERSFAARLRRVPVASMMRPLFWLQEFAKDTNVGDGFLVLARRPN
jgi:SAM-dependent methyltransferase